MKLRKCWRIAVAMACLFDSALISQTPTGSISGVVSDESGAVIPGAKVTVTNIEKGISQLSFTDGAGRYHVPALIPGNYEAQAQMEGFQTGIRKWGEQQPGLGGTGPVL